MFQIESGVPLVNRGRGRGTGSKYPFADMDVGESFYAEIKPSALRSAATVFSKKNAGYKFAIRSENTGARVWRIA